MTAEGALRAILEIAYEGHPDGRADRLKMITRIAEAALRAHIPQCHFNEGLPCICVVGDPSHDAREVK